MKILKRCLWQSSIFCRIQDYKRIKPNDKVLSKYLSRIIELPQINSLHTKNNAKQTEYIQILFVADFNCVKSDRIWSFSGPYFLAFGLNTERYRVSLYSVRMRENTYQKNSEYGHFSRSVYYIGKNAIHSDAVYFSTSRSPETVHSNSSETYAQQGKALNGITEASTRSVL